MNFVNTLATNKTAVYHNEAAFGDDVNCCLDAFAMSKSTVVMPGQAASIEFYNATTYSSGDNSDNLSVRWKANDFNLRTDLMTTDEWLQIPAVLEMHERERVSIGMTEREAPPARPWPLTRTLALPSPFSLHPSSATLTLQESATTRL